MSKGVQGEDLDAEIGAERLAAIRAALDPERREMRHDVLVSGVIEILHRRPEISADEVTDLSCHLWCTTSITRLLIERALAIARKSNLARDEIGLDEVARWRLTEQGRTLAAADHASGAQTLADFASEVGRRLDEADDERVGAENRDRVSRIIMSSVADVMADNYAIASGGLDLAHIRPVNLDVNRVVRLVSERTEPKSLRLVAIDIVIEALDPDVPFGNEVVRLLTVGNILHAFATRRDAQVSLGDVRIVLDTSVLVGLAAEPKSIDRRIIDDIVARSKAAGVDVVVPDHVLEEWDRLWDAATGDVDLIVEVDLSVTGRLVGNPFVRYFLLAQEVDAKLTWADFQRHHRDIRRSLQQAGVSLRPHGNHDPKSQEVAERIASEIRERTKDSYRKRSKANAAADGHSIAMVDRWRREGGSSAGFFVSRGTLPGRVHRDVTGDPVSVELSPEAWMLFLASVCTDDHAEQSSVARMIADSAIRSSFFGVAVTYTVEDVIELSRRLAANGGAPTIEDSRMALQMDLLELLDESDSDSASLDRKISAVVQHRQTRATIRLAREQSQLERRIADTTTRADAQVAEAENRRRAADDRAGQAATEADASQREAIFWKRAALGAVPAAGLLVLALVLVSGGLISPWSLLFVGGFLFLYGARLHELASDADADVAAFVRRECVELAVVVLIEIGITVAL